MREVALVGAGMTRFAKHLDKGMKELSREAIEGALKSAGVEAQALEAVAVGNAMAGLITGQECIRGQVVLREMGMEKLYHEDKKKSFAALGSAIDVELMQETLADMKKSTEEKGGGAGAGKSRSMFMDFYAEFARSHMRKYGTTKEHYAQIAAKNHTNGSLNPHAQFQTPRSMEDVLASPMIADPLTRMMCSPIGDGAAALVLTSAEKAKEFTTKPVYVKASVLGSGKDRQPGDPGVTERMAKKAYEVAGIGPEDLDVAEVHDASAPAELIIYEELGLCQQGEGVRLIDEGVTALGGKTPVKPSGGLLAKGHPVGATGTAQIAEIFWQLRGEAGKRQVEGARVGLTENGGGMVRGEAAALAVHILSV